MQKALDHLEDHKVFIEALNTHMVPLSEAYKAIQLSIDQQLTDVTTVLESSLGKLGIDINEIQNELENDQDSTRES
jgi:hypothetical protein